MDSKSLLEHDLRDLPRLFTSLDFTILRKIIQYSFDFTRWSGFSWLFIWMI